MKKKYVLGVDGGGTKTHCALFDTEGNKIDLISWGTTNHEYLRDGFIGLKRELESMTSLILEKNGVSNEQIRNAVFGLAGVDTKTQQAVISNIISEIGFKKHHVCNDAYLGIKAGSKKGYGICAVNGTGCSVTGISPSGRCIQIGGLGELTGDKGGGSYLGATVIGTIYNSLFKDGKQTLMKDLLFDELKITSRYEFIDTIMQKLSSGEIRISDLNRIAFAAANMGDEKAIEILTEMGKDIASMINGAIRELEPDFEDSIDVVLAGSIHVKGENPTATETIKHCVRERNKNRAINFVVLEKPPVAGAVIWALSEERGCPDMYEKVLAQF